MTLPAGTDDSGIDALITPGYRTAAGSATWQGVGVTVEAVADELYALPPEDFTAARTAAAKADKANAKQINALRKPTVGAWLVNRLARNDSDLLEQLLRLGPALADAQQTGQGDALRELGQQRRQLLAAVTDTAFAAAGRAPTAASRAEVESTLEAALADPTTADAVRSGRLVRSLSYAGFGGVDLDGAVAISRPSKTALAEKPPDKAVRSRDIAAAERGALEAAGALDDAVRRCEQAQRDHDAADAAEQAAAADVRTSEAALRAGRQRRTEAESAARKARHRSEQAAQAVASAQENAEKTRAVLDKLRRA